MPNPSKMMEGTSVRSSSEGIQLSQLPPHILSVAPVPITSETQQINVRGSSLTGQLKIRIIDDSMKSVSEIEVNSQNNTDIQLGNLNIAPGRYSLQIEHAGGQSNPFPIEIQALKQPTSETPEKTTAPTHAQLTEPKLKEKVKRESRKPLTDWSTEKKSAKLTMANWKRISIEAVKTNRGKFELVNEIIDDYFNRKGDKI